MPDKPTSAVRPESLPVPEGHTERRDMRTLNSKTFVKPEKHNGKDVFICEARLEAVCYLSDDNEWRSIDTEVRDIGDGQYGVEWAPYKFYVHKAGIGFDFHSRAGGFVRVTLIGVGEEIFDTTQKMSPTYTDNAVVYYEIRPGCDIVFQCHSQRVKTLRVLKNADAPKVFRWRCEYDNEGQEKILPHLFGTDAMGDSLELELKIEEGGKSHQFVEEIWTGRVKKITDLATRIKSYSTDVAWPVSIDPTVNYSVTTGADDGRERSGSWYNSDSYLITGNFSFSWSLGVRFQGVSIPQGSTINSATLSLYCIGANYGATRGGLGKIYGYDTDDAAAFSSTIRPTNVSKTTASTLINTPPSVGAWSDFNVASIVQEIVDRGGWASGNDMSFPIIDNSSPSGRYTFWEAYERSPSTNNPALSITYTAAAAGAGMCFNKGMAFGKGRIFGGRAFG